MRHFCNQLVPTGLTRRQCLVLIQSGDAATQIISSSISHASAHRPGARWHSFRSARYHHRQENFTRRTIGPWLRARAIAT